MRAEPGEPVDMLLTVKDVAELLSVAVRTVWRWVGEGKLPGPLHLGRRTTRWRASDVQAYIDGVSRPGAPTSLAYSARSRATSASQ